MKSNIFKFFISLALVVNLLCIPVKAADMAAWNVHYYSGAPSPVSEQSDYLSVTYYGAGFVAKATSLSGSYNRYIEIYGRNGTTLSLSTNGASYVNITQVNILTPYFETNYIQPTGSNPAISDFTAFGHGLQSCVSTGWIYINSPSVYNS